MAEAISPFFAEAELRCRAQPDDEPFMAEIEPDGIPGATDASSARAWASILDALIDAGGLDADEAGVDACIAALEDASCGEILLGIPEGCHGALRPTRAEGEACMTSIECVDGLCDGFGDCGVCFPVDPELIDQEDCFETGCDPGLVCVFDRDTDRLSCERPAASGEACEPVPCDEGLSCLGSNPGEAGTCGAPPALGEQCGDRRLGQACADGLACDRENTFTCVTPPGEGERCAGEDEPCADGLRCGNNFTCVAAPAEGEPCNDGICANGLECAVTVEGEGPRCQLVLRGASAGDPCTPLVDLETCGGPTLSTGLYCAGAPGEETCQAAEVVGEGEVCDADNRVFEGTRYCRHQLSTHTCFFATPDAETGICQPRVGPGEACDEEVRCDETTSRCSSFEGGVCEAFAALGESCDSASCAAGLFCVDEEGGRTCSDTPDLPVDEIEACLGG